MKVVLFEDHKVLNLEPLTLNRPVFDLRYGSGTLLNRVNQFFPNNSISLWVREAIKELTLKLHQNAQVNELNKDNLIWLNARVIWNRNLIDKVISEPSSKFSDGDELLAANLSFKQSKIWLGQNKTYIQSHPKVKDGKKFDYKIIEYLWDLLGLIPDAVAEARNKYEKLNVHKNVVFNEDLGPIVLGQNVQINPFSTLEGPLYIGKNCIIKSNSQISKSIIGPHCKVGGEVSGSIIQGYTNKSHHGFIGDSFIGEWVNLGAGTTNSNLKNNYKNVSMIINDQLINSHRLFLGSFIGDHTKTSIGTILNTGTNIGIGCNIVSNTFPPRNIVSFSLINKDQIKRTPFKELVSIAQKVKSRREKVFCNEEIKYFQYIYDSI